MPYNVLSSNLTFTSAGLKSAGFAGFHPLSETSQEEFEDVPDGPGVFVVLRESSQPPNFLHNDPTLPRNELYSRWVPDTPVLLVGRTAQLRRRVERLAFRGAGRTATRWTGRVLWQLADAQNLRVAWLSLPQAEEGTQLRIRILNRFLDQFGRPPFGNIKRKA